MAPPIIVIFVIYTGVFINNDSLPPGSEWLSYISFIKWAFAGITINEYTDKTDFEVAIGIEKPSDVLDMFGIGQYSVSDCYLYLFFIQLGFLVLGYFALKLNDKKYMKA